MANLPKLIAVVGPTASGKTSLGIEIAKRFDGEVISVDSRQIYLGMDIGTAKSEGEWKEEEIEIGGSIKQLFGARQNLVVDGVVHWGIDLVEPNENYSVAQFKEYAEDRINDILSRGKLPVLVGGTGFWLQVIIDNLKLTEGRPDTKLRLELEARDIDDLFDEYKRLDPKGAEVIESRNKRRLIRALEVTKKTGKPFSEQQLKGDPKYEVFQVGFDVDREELYSRINDRVVEMIAKGLVSEVRSLKEKYGCEIESMTGIGYRQICKFLDGEEKLEDAIGEIKKDSRHYAKRQLTWFKRDERINWVEDEEKAIKLVESFVKK